MENQSKQACTREKNSFEFASIIGDNSAGDAHTQERLAALLAANLEIKREKASYHDEQERFDASLMKSPITTDKAFAYLGLMLGLFPPFAMFAKFFFASPLGNDRAFVIAIMLFMNAACAVVGYFSGKLIGKIISNIEKLSWTKMLLILPFLGILWGIMTGGAGGIIVFIIGAFFGAVIASMVGGIAIPAFTIFHRLLKKGELIEEKHFFPVAMGITCAITALILGL